MASKTPAPTSTPLTGPRREAPGKVAPTAPAPIREAVWKERRRFVRSIPVPEAREVDTDSAWAPFQELDIDAAGDPATPPKTPTPPPRAPKR